MVVSFYESSSVGDRCWVIHRWSAKMSGFLLKRQGSAEVGNRPGHVLLKLGDGISISHGASLVLKSSIIKQLKKYPFIKGEFHSSYSLPFLRPSSSISFFFIYFEALLLVAYLLRIYYLHSELNLLSLGVTLSLMMCFALKSILFAIDIASLMSFY